MNTPDLKLVGPRAHIRGLEDAARIARARRELYYPNDGPLEQLAIYLFEMAEKERAKIGWHTRTGGKDE